MWNIVLSATLFFAGTALCFAAGQETAGPSDKIVMKARLAGNWYPGDHDELEKTLEAYFRNVTLPLQRKNVIGLIQPHAGYRYSGQTAAFGAKQLEDSNCKRVVILGPSHKQPLINSLCVPDVTHFSTPLGEVPLDREFIHALVKNKFVVRNSPYHDFEHSVQIQLPLLQYTLEKFTLVPIIVGQTDRKTIAEAAAALLALVDDSTLVIASSDFTHYGKDYGYVPFTDDIPESLSKLDMGAFDLIKKKDPAGFLDYCDKTGDTICGKYPVAILLSMLPADSEVSLLNYTTSGKITGSYTASVSYISASVTGSWGGRPAAAAAKTPDAAKSPDSAQSELSDQDKKDLLKLARKTLELYLKTKKIPSAEDTGVKITPAMKKVMGAFVTLHDSRGELRGCIGEIRPSRPLFEAVMAHAVNAGVRDYRFSPVTPDELASLDFEISALTPPAPVASYKDIVIGRHGMTLSKDGRSAVFLPQVAPEQGWTLEETLKHLSVKAGLRPDDWKDGAFFTVFEAIVFGEKDRGKKH